MISVSKGSLDASSARRCARVTGFRITKVPAAPMFTASRCLSCLLSVVGRNVARRTNEIGVRMALGADRRAVLGLVFRESLRLSLFGLAAGLLGALALTRALTGLLYGVSASDPWSLLGSALALGTVTALAIYLPARRAATIDPIAALRNE